MSSEVKVMLTSKNKKQFVIENFIFQSNKVVTNKEKIIYYTKCIHSRVNNCKAKCIIEEVNNKFHIKSINNDHFEHNQPLKKLLSTKLKTELRSQIKIFGATNPMNQIYKNSVQVIKSQFSKEEFLEFETPYSNVRSSMYCIKNESIPKLPKTLVSFYY